MSRRRPGISQVVWWVAPPLVTAVLVVIGYLWKVSCALPGERLGLVDVAQRMCLTDIGSLWSSRQLATHQFPYVHAVFTPPQGLTGAVEYPVLSGMLIWLVGLGATDVVTFLTVNAIVLGACAVVVSVLIRGLAGRRVWLWAAAPAMLLYVVYNWDTWTVLAATASMMALAVGRRGTAPPTVAATIVAGVLLGLGGALKVYPLLLLLPLMFWVFDEARVRGLPLAHRLRRAAIPAIAAGVVLLVSNLPLMIVNFAGWMTPITFQNDRALRGDTMSIWFWMLRPFVRPESQGIQPLINVVTLTATVVAVVAVLAVGWRLARQRGSYPFLAVSLAVVAAYIVFGKVSSPQYLLWLIPLVAVVAVRVRWVVALYAVDALMFVAWFQILGQSNLHPDLSRAFQVVVAISVFVRAGLIIVVTVQALASRSPVLPRWRTGPDPVTRAESSNV